MKGKKNEEKKRIKNKQLRRWGIFIGRSMCPSKKTLGEVLDEPTPYNIYELVSIAERRPQKWWWPKGEKRKG